MGKRSAANIQSELDPVEIDTVSSYTDVEPVQRVLVQSIFPARIRQTGRVSGEQYVWQAPGDIVSCDPRDVEHLLTVKVGTTSCCGSTQRGNMLFKTV